MPGLFRRLERDAIMEWIIVRRRLLAVLTCVLIVVVAAASGILFSVGVSHLSTKELRHFGHEQALLSHNNIQGGEIVEEAPHEK
jgi:hypothetical protein